MNIFEVPKKETVNATMSAKSIALVGLSKTGKSTLASQAPRPIFLMTENGVEGLTGMVPIPIGSWTDFKQAVTQLCMPKGRENFDTVVIDTYTNLILLLDKYIGQKMSTDQKTFAFGSDAEFGKGVKAMKNELGVQLQKLANQGYLLLNIVHAEYKTDFNTQQSFVGTSLSSGMYGTIEKFVDQIVYLKKDIDKNTGEFIHTIWYNGKGGFPGAGGRWTPNVDSSPCTYADLERVMLDAIKTSGENKGATLINETMAPAVSINAEEPDFNELIAEFKSLTDEAMEKDPESNSIKIRNIVESVLGVGKKVNNLSSTQVELLAEVIEKIKEAEF